MNIVLDIDETLIHSQRTPSKNAKLKLDFGPETYHVLFRPGLKEFLRFVFKNFKTVNIWTAGTQDYAYRIMSNVLTKTQRKKLKFFNTRKHVVNGTKPLDKIFQTPEAVELDIHAYNTIIIDDKKDVIQHNPGNGIIIPAFTGNQKDMYLYKLIVVLQGILELDLIIHPQQNHIDLRDITD